MRLAIARNLRDLAARLCAGKIYAHPIIEGQRARPDNPPPPPPRPIPGVEYIARPIPHRVCGRRGR